MIDLSTTIVAISSPIGMGATATLRISGPQAMAIADRLFVSPSGHTLAHQAPNTIRFGRLVHQGQLIDEVMAAVMHGPRSYTGQDTVELYCHGSTYIQQRILQALVHCGARMAQPGEYTLRAYLNGKLDLVQAEAVGDLIASTTATMHQVALQQMRGGYSRQIRDLREQLLHFQAMLELELDFGEEDVEFANRAQLQQLLTTIIDTIDTLTASFASGNAIKQGVPVAIVGQPNVGKSTLLNALLRDDRAIVTDIAGTTRDTIEDTVVLGGILFRMIDTAGLRHTSDTIEQLGIARSRQKLAQAQIALIVLDASEPHAQLLQQVQQLATEPHQYYIVLLNKADQLPPSALAQAQAALQPLVHQRLALLPLSGKSGLGLPQLEQLLVQYAAIPQALHTHSIVTNARHYEAFVRTQVLLLQARTALQEGLGQELIAFEIREAAQELAGIVGQIDHTEVLEKIFGSFCIGK